MLEKAEILGYMTRVKERTKMEEMLKVRDLRRVLCCGERAVYQLIRNGRIQGVRVGNAWRVTPQSLREFLLSGGGSGQSQHREGRPD